MSSLNGFVQQFVQQLLFAVLDFARMCTSVRTDVAFLCTSVRTSVDKKATDVRTDVAFFCTYYLLICNLVCESQYNTQVINNNKFDDLSRWDKLSMPQRVLLI